MDYFRKQSFSVLLLLSVLLAGLFPDFGKSGGYLHSEWLIQIGVWLIFLFQGLGLPTSELTNGYRPKRLHVFVLSWNYLLFPLAAACVLLILGWFMPEPFRVGIWLLAILPTTVSSAVIFSSVSEGHVSNAIFSTVLSNVLSVLIVPGVAVAYLASEGAGSVALAPLFGKLFFLIIFPLIIGQLVRRACPGPAAVTAKRCEKLSRAIILFIVFAAFSNSVDSGFVKNLSWEGLLPVVTGIVILLGFVSGAVWWSAGKIGLNRAQQISAFYCASQKSLATGLPLLTSVLAAAPGVLDPAAVLIPLMCYHPAQLILAGWFSQHLLKQSAVSGEQS